METNTMERTTSGGAPAAPQRALAVREPDMKWLDIPRDELIPTLQQSLFPGAKPESVAAVLDYCAAAGLNVMLKPVHIVPMNVKVGPGRNDYAYRDVVMPGINHYRTQASRTGTYAGKTEPEWGPDITLQFGDYKITVPEWCKVTVKRKVGAFIAEFTAQEYWTENYATKGRDSETPNAMWQKRPRGQLHKCTEAQALRIAFPELLGGETAEEMEGKVIDLTAEDLTPRPRAATQSLDSFSGGPVDAGDVEQVEGEVIDDKPPRQPGKKDTPEAIPKMPAKALKAFVEKGEWALGWEWLNSVIEKLSPAGRQTLADQHNALLWAVYNSDAPQGPQCKAAQEFTNRWELRVDPPQDGDANGS